MWVQWMVWPRMLRAIMLVVTIEEEEEEESTMTLTIATVIGSSAAELLVI